MGGEEVKKIKTSLRKSVGVWYFLIFNIREKNRAVKCCSQAIQGDRMKG